ncbi:hypothetical protein M153_1785000183 [Pseudoloma neurophilia]|uniref:Uncharacterized protein n=1 Tax=Pseudoloma neurophilia TaxID=146866 RepID=A0A0R0LUB7_9MICR|nr:hypothetical protein M153_1785000183 [Pseudoloma neurophilia]
MLFDKTKNSYGFICVSLFFILASLLLFQTAYFLLTVLCLISILAFITVSDFYLSYVGYQKYKKNQLQSAPLTVTEFITGLSLIALIVGMGFGITICGCLLDYYQSNWATSILSILFFFYTFIVGKFFCSVSQSEKRYQHSCWYIGSIRIILIIVFITSFFFEAAFTEGCVFTVHALIAFSASMVTWLTKGSSKYFAYTFFLFLAMSFILFNYYANTNSMYMKIFQ